MELILQIVSGGGARASERRKAFGREGGRIGRAADCEWVLPSPYVSRHHATVSHAGNVFYIESTGENGLALNDPTRFLARFDRHALKEGDRLFIDEMEITVMLAGAGRASDASPEFPELHGNTAGPLDPTINELDPLRRLLADSGPLSDTAERAVPWNNSSSLADHFAPPRREQAAPPALAGAVAEDWDDEAAERPASAPPVPRASSPAVSPRGQVATPVPPAQSTLGPAAAKSARPEPAASPVPSDVLRSMLQGLIDERQSRAQMAAELHLRSLPLALSNPNPLHHAVNADDALRLLAPAPEAGRMTGAQAIADALEEIRAHQLATSAAIQAAFQALMSGFDPQSLEARFNRRLKHAGVLPIGSKFRYWQLYIELFEELTSASDSGFQKLFGEAFAEAYAETYTHQLTASKGRARQPAHGT